MALMDLNSARAIFDSLGEGVYTLDVDGRVTFVNRAAQELLGWTEDELQGRDMHEVIHFQRADGSPFPRSECPLLEVIASARAVHSEDDVFTRKDGSTFPVAYTSSPLMVDGAVAGAALAFSDISERRRMEQEREELVARLEALARTDQLTGLPNRRAWDEALQLEVERARRQKQPLAVVMLDLDLFKDYNDEHGHLDGDELLGEAGRAWRLALRVSDVLARFGGDEFALVLPVCPPDEGNNVLARLRAATPSGQTCSAGIAYWDWAESPESLVRRADGALYEAKRGGRDRAVVAGDTE